MKQFSWKALSSAGILLVSVFFFSGCNLFDKVDDVSFNSELTVTWSVDENGDATSVPYMHSETVSFEDDPEISKYINKIKDVKLEKVTYRIEDYNADPHGGQVIFNNGMASFSTTGSSTPAVAVPFAATAPGVNLQTIITDTELDISTEELNEIAAIFKQEKKIDMLAAGVLSRTPVSFKVVSVFHVKITADVID